jgi:hypothetical protein
MYYIAGPKPGIKEEGNFIYNYFRFSKIYLILFDYF